MQPTMRLTLATLLAATTGMTFALPAPAQDLPIEGDSALVLGYSMDRAIGAPVRGADNTVIGEIEDIVLTVDGEADRAILSVGGYLGVGDKQVVVPYDALTFAADHAVLNGVTRQALENQPTFVYPESDEILIAKVPGGAAASDEEAALVEDMENYAREAATEMQQWQTEVERYADDVKQGTIETSRQTQKAVEDSWTAVENEWQRLSHATADSWEEVRRGFESARADFEKQWQDPGAESAGEQQDGN